jgi:2-dehydro-3-deoxyphosphogluconate aldolase/(4S)-4-hydroxy-2-oxoglutarate aldolase
MAMPRFLKHQVMAAILNIGLLPVFYNGDVEVAKKIVESCVDEGARVLEFTNRGDSAYQVFNTLYPWCTRELPDVILGAGTIIDSATAALYINCGTDFIVGTLFNPEVAKLCNRRRVAYIPGCQTPTEISHAEEMGSDVVKVFPAKVLTPSFIKAVLGPCPQSTLMVSGGVEATREDVFTWINAGAKALNISSNLITRQALKGNDYSEIRNRVEHSVQWIQEAREGHE